MENATKALLIAGGVLIAIIILSVMVILFQKTGNVTKTYGQTISQEEITKFNSNFTKYLDKKFTIHEAITITNFANSNGVKVNNPKETKDINNKSAKEKKYTLTVENYGLNGFIDEITISAPA